ncbi:MAG: serine/threonine protein kinase [Proteobacteria bacterium]|nr:serine/threonine protein kinase [Pseudomonadota bacterium]
MIAFGRYQVIRKLGAGGLSDVFLAEMPEDAEPAFGLAPGDRVALKVLRDSDPAGRIRERFLREGRMLQRLAHPGLPGCFEIAATERPYLALELLEGSALNERLRATGPLSEDEVLSLAETLLDTLAFLHARGIVHRDVKAANIFLCDDGRVKLVDLGLARDPSDPGDAQVGDVLGTYAYMAPEQIAGAGSDARADLYALGVTLFECLAGARPYKARGPAAYLKAHTRGERKDLPDTASPRLSELISRLMARDPASRPQSATLARAILTGHIDDGRSLRGAPLVGRQAVVGALDAVLDAGGLLQVVGEPGMGLGRIAREAWSLAERRELPVVAIRCVAGAPTEAPLRSLQRAIGALGLSDDELVDALQERGGLLIVERADASHPKLRRRLASILERTGLGVLLTADRKVAGVGGHVITLRDLRPGEVATLLTGMLGTRRTPPGQAQRLHAFTGGLPGAVVLTLRDFVERGVLRCDGSTEGGDPVWTMAPTARMRQDSSMARLFRRRLDRLGLDERRLLELLAVGRTPLPEDLALEFAGLTDHLVPHRLEQAWLVVREDGFIGIRRAALAAVLLREAGDVRVHELHALLAGELADRSEPWAADRSDWHRAHAAPRGRAGREMVLLAERLVANARSSDALGVLLKASLGGRLAPEDAARAALARGQALLHLGRAASALEALAAARTLGVDQGLVELVFGVDIEQARAWRHRGELSRAVDRCDSVVRGRDGRLAARALLVRASCHALLGDRRKAAMDYRQVADQALAAEERELAARAHGGIGCIYAQVSRLGDAMRHLRQESAWLRRNAPGPRLAMSSYELSECLLRVGHLDEADQVIQTAAPLLADSPFPTALLGVARARVLLAVGDPASAHALLERHWLAGSADASAQSRTLWLETRVACRLATDDRSSALAAANRVLELAEQVGWTSRRAAFRGLVAVLRGRPDGLNEAVRALDAAGERRALVRLMLEAGKLGDAAILDAAVAEAGQMSDVFLYIETLHTAGGEGPRRLAAAQVERVRASASGELLQLFENRKDVRWALGASTGVPARMG